MSRSLKAYDAGCEAAKVAFFGELYDKYVKGNLGPLHSTFVTRNPAFAGVAGAAGQALDTPPEGSTILRSLGVGGGSAAANALVNPVAKIVAATVVSSMGLNPASQWTGLLQEGLRELPTGLAQSFAATKGRDAAIHAEKALRSKGLRIP